MKFWKKSFQVLLLTKPYLIDASLRAVWRSLTPPNSNYPEEEMQNAIFLLHHYKRRFTIIQRRKFQQWVRRNADP